MKNDNIPVLTCIDANTFIFGDKLAIKRKIKEVIMTDQVEVIDLPAKLENVSSKGKNKKSKSTKPKTKVTYGYLLLIEKGKGKNMKLYTVPDMKTVSMNKVYGSDSGKYHIYRTVYKAKLMTPPHSENKSGLIRVYKVSFVGKFDKIGVCEVANNVKILKPVTYALKPYEWGWGNVSYKRYRKIVELYCKGWKNIKVVDSRRMIPAGYEPIPVGCVDKIADKKSCIFICGKYYYVRVKR